MKQAGFFDVSERRVKTRDFLERVNRFVRWEAFRPELDKALARKARDKGGSPPFDAVLMFKILVLQALYNDIRPLRTVPAEFNRIFDRKAAQRITTALCQPDNPKLPDSFFGLGGNVLLANRAPENGLLALFNEERPKCPQLITAERFQGMREVIASKKIQKSHSAPHNQR